MEYILTGNEMKFTERYTIDDIGVPSVALMETASRNAYEEIIKETGKNDCILICCGTGNNGADGLCVSRFLYQNGYNVYPLITGNTEKASEEWKLQFDIVNKMGISFADTEILDKPWFKPDIIVDALFGIGLSRDITGEVYNLIGKINSYKENLNTKVFSLDIPSGLSASDGRVYGICVNADITVTNQCLKTGLVLGDAPEYTGRLVVRDTGILLKETDKYAFSYNEEDLKNLAMRKKTGNKGTNGKVLIIAGSETMPGAAVLSGRSAFMSGSGMVKIVSSKANRELYIHELPEAMLGFYEDYTEKDFLKDFEWCSVCIIGPGLSTSNLAFNIVFETMKNCRKTIVADADALNIISQKMDVLEYRKREGLCTILTPHPGEFSRLFGTDITDKNHQNIDFIKKKAESLGIILVAKDARTIITDGNRVCINCDSTPALSTAGSGDVLAGITGALCGYHKNIFEAVCLAVFIHSLAGKDAAYEYGERSVTASSVVDGIYRVIG